jgi:xanthine dehydrogenase accessory factor
MSELDAGFDLATAGHDAWLQPLNEWPEAVKCWLQSETAVARIVVACVRGSAPREAGTCMLVSNSQILGTIGGGHLEWVAIDTARQLLTRCEEAPVRVQRLVLGADLAQCCGGVVDLWIERYTQSDVELLDRVVDARRSGGEQLVSKLTAEGIERQLMPKGSEDEEWGHSSLPRRKSPPDSGTFVASTSVPQGDFRWGIPTLHPQIHFAWPSATNATLTESLDAPLPSIWLYGAGHVGQALVRVLDTLPVRVTWIDSRRDLLPEATGAALDIRNADRPELTVPDAPPQTHFIVMTHDHALDYTLCRRILERGDFASLGVIGSKSKAARFRSRLARDGLTPERIAQMRCPIGIDGLKSKLPAVIAVAVAAQLLQAIEARAATVPTSSAGADCDATGAACRTCGLLHRAS